ncbi:hypothetical protein M2651_12625 [Clostridium sp. SYSU_GA19001]|uniref:hypothetical protein n=1 Tax=Clostridium caldaquaticum TaxID=2940653 RepID=UPI00207727B7|nr:hypothetical protein [Clostridium caldaquaticum]MCM8711856.1 hypothetical protein [Clostridium caldaquaticum]
MSKKYYNVGGSKPTLPSLVILILIILQFSGNGLGYDKHSFNGIDNGILFIIALFYLSCCNTCKSDC